VLGGRGLETAGSSSKKLDDPLAFCVAGGPLAGVKAETLRGGIDAAGIEAEGGLPDAD